MINSNINTAIYERIINLQIAFLNKNPTVIRTTPPDNTNEWLMLLVGETEDKEISNTHVSCNLTRKAYSLNYVPPKTLRELLARDRILVKRINRKSYLKMIQSKG